MRGKSVRIAVFSMLADEWPEVRAALRERLARAALTEDDRAAQGR